MIAKLKQTYRKVLIKIARSLSLEQQNEFSFYCTGCVLRPCDPSESSKWTLKLLQSLEEAAKVFWADVSFLIECMHVIGREDLASELLAFEISRELTILLTFYAGKGEGLECYCGSMTVSAAKSLPKLLDGYRDKIHVSDLLQSGMDEKNLWRSFEKVIRDDEVPESLSDMAFLVAVTGEIITVSCGHRSQEEVMEMASDMAGPLHRRVAKLGNWVRTTSQFYN